MLTKLLLTNILAIIFLALGPFVLDLIFKIRLNERQEVWYGWSFGFCIGVLPFVALACVWW